MNGSPSDEETAALLALDALLPGEQADAELRIGMLPADLAGVAALLAEETVTDPPPEPTAAWVSSATSPAASTGS